ncbi:MAG: hypothetical protein LBS83_03680, partial [Holosporales bacterium]|nr:hypothetical protein [Holosporales bacterium]
MKTIIHFCIIAISFNICNKIEAAGPRVLPQSVEAVLTGIRGNPRIDPEKGVQNINGKNIKKTGKQVEKRLISDHQELLPENIDRFIEFEVPGDGDCGYTSIGITRGQAADLLLAA